MGCAPLPGDPGARSQEVMEGGEAPSQVAGLAAEKSGSDNELHSFHVS